MIVALAILVVLIVVNGLLAMSEMALAASRRARLERRASEGDPRAQAALRLYEAPNRFLSTVQIGISLVGVISGAFGGQALAGPLAALLGTWGLPERWAATLAFVVVVGGITFFALVVGELVPKRLALAAPERVAMAVARPMEGVSRLSAPLVAVLSWSTNIVLRPFRVSGRQESDASPEEITSLLQQSHRVGHIGEHEVEMIQNVFDISDRRVRSMITPRRDVTWLDVEAPWEETRLALIEASHSRLPVARGQLDHVLGVVHVHEILDRLLLQEPIDLLALAAPALEVPESLRATALLERFRAAGTRFAVVLDEYGGVEGIVTAGDVLQALLGELADVAGDEDRSVARLGRDRFDLDGTLYVEELKDLLGIASLPREEERDYRTLGGLVTTLAGRIPAVGDDVAVAGWRFEVMALDGPRVDRVLVEREDAVRRSKRLLDGTPRS